MSQKQYLNEEKYQKMKKIFQTFYLILAIVGIGMVIAGIILLVKNNSVDYINLEKIIAYLLILVGVVLTGMSLADLFRHTFTRDIQSYYVQQQMPLAQEGIENMAPSVGVAAKEISKGIKEGLNEVDKK